MIARGHRKKEVRQMAICVFCDNEVTLPDYGPTFCHNCGEYKGIMDVEDWEEYTGQTWF